MTKTTSLLTKRLSISADFMFWRSHARFIFENIAASVIAVDVSGCITIFNEEAEQTFCRQRGEVVGKPLWSVFPGMAEHEYYLLHALQSGRELKDAEYSYCPYSGREGAFVHSVSLVKGTHGEVVGAIWMRKDVTDERNFQREVCNAEIQAMISQIAAGTAHEIRNPLTSAKGYLQLAIQRCGKNSVTREYLTMACEEIDQANRIISDFLALVHPGVEGLQFVSFNCLITDLVQLVEKVATMLNIEIAAELDEQIPLCVLDQKMVKKATLNVVNNAIQAMPQGGRLSISTRYLRQQNRISVVISDTGVGIRQEDLNRVLTPFYSTRVDGSGLGLTLTNRIVQHHNGHLQITSKEGEGTTVTLFFPVSHT